MTYVDAPTPKFLICGSCTDTDVFLAARKRWSSYKHMIYHSDLIEIGLLGLENFRGQRDEVR